MEQKQAYAVFEWGIGPEKDTLPFSIVNVSDPALVDYQNNCKYIAVFLELESAKEYVVLAIAEKLRKEIGWMNLGWFADRVRQFKYPEQALQRQNVCDIGMEAVAAHSIMRA